MDSFDSSPVSPSPRPPALVPEPAPNVGKPPTSGLAIAALVFGFLPCGLTGIVGLLCGLVAKSRISKSQGRMAGNSLATAGIIVSVVVGLMLPLGIIQAGIKLPAFARAKGKSQRITCGTNLKRLGLAFRQYALDNGANYPEEISKVKAEIEKPSYLICPADSSRQPALSWNKFTTNNCSYPYFGSEVNGEDRQFVISYCTNHGPNEVLLLRADGSVQPITHLEFSQLLRLKGGRTVMKVR